MGGSSLVILDEDLLLQPRPVSTFLHFFHSIFSFNFLPWRSSLLLFCRVWFKAEGFNSKTEKERERERQTHATVYQSSSCNSSPLSPARTKKTTREVFFCDKPTKAPLLFFPPLPQLPPPPSLFTPLSWRKYQQHGIRGGIPSPKEKIRFWSQGRIEIQIGIDGIEWKEQEILIAPSSSSKQSSEETFACQEFLNPRGGSQTWPPKLQKKKNQTKKKKKKKEKKKKNPRNVSNSSKSGSTRHARN